jgi:hypothetical protein
LEIEASLREFSLNESFARMLQLILLIRPGCS